MRATGDTEKKACPRGKRWDAVWTGVLAVTLALTIAGSYSNTFSAPFVFDDLSSIPFNPTIRHVWPPATALNPPAGGQTVSGRPVLNFSFAINYAIGRLEVRGYHVVNLAVHILSAWTLFALARRTVSKTAVGTTPERARFLGFVIALLWALHPLQTGAITYVVQRAESLMGLFYLLTVYCFVRGAQDGEAAALRASRWYALAVVTCCLGVATKEVMVSAPVVILLYDRTFLAGSISKALRTRATVYAGLFCTWLPLAWLVMANGDRGDTAGLGLGWTAGIDYARTQFPAIIHYLRLIAWPNPLVFDYGANASQIGWILPACAVGALLAVTLYYLWRNRAAGFLGAWFFAILAPTSSIVPIATEPMAEHRMYLPLAAVVAAGVCGSYACAKALGLTGPRLGTWAGLLALALSLGGLTFARNADYRSELALWRDTVAKRPDNFSARHNLALALDAAGDVPAAMTEYSAALRLDPDNPKTRNNFGNLLKRSGRTTEAADEFRETLRIDPNNAEGHNNLGVILAINGNVREAMTHFDRALETKPNYAEAHFNRGLALKILGRISESDAEFEKARQLKSALAQ